MNRSIRAGYPLWVALFLYWLLTFALLAGSLVKTSGHFGYPLDDTYIHMAMARHTVESGTWGLTKYAFSSSTSAPLWTALLAAAYKIFGVSDWMPFALCLVTGSVLLVAANHILKEVSNPARRTAYLLLVVLFTPLPILTLVGMEHVLHGLLSLCLIYMAATYLERGIFGKRELALLAVASGLLTVTRYEGIFLIATIVVLYVLSRRFVPALVVGAAGFASVAAYGAVSMAQGWYFAPNSVLLKATGMTFSLQGLVLFIQQLPFNLAGTPHILVLILACLAVYLFGSKQGAIGRRGKYLVAIYVPVTLLHLQFASVDHFFRYEAYLVVLGLVIALDLGDRWLRARPFGQPVRDAFEQAAIAVLLLLAAAPMVSRMYVSLISYPRAVANIYEQQYQMARFFRQYYTGRTVALNDIGAVDYLADVQTVDLYGLDSMDIAKAKLENVLDSQTIQRVTTARSTEIVFIYDEWFTGKIPTDWVPVGTWTIPDNVICFDATVHIYAPGPQWEQATLANLRDFSASLPADVEQSGKYTLP